MQAGRWLAEVKRNLGDDLQITWRSFALEQVNSKEGPDWKAWEQGPEYESRGLLALRAAEASRGQDGAAHQAFVANLLEARHEHKKDLRDREVILDVARESGLDLPAFEQALDDPDTLATVGRDHDRAAELGVFGTPTFVFSDDPPMFLKTYTPPAEEAMTVWGHFIGLSRGAKYVGEVKRPQPPWPRGVFDDS